MSSPGWRTNGVNVDKRKTINKGNKFEKPKGEPTPVQRLVRRDMSTTKGATISFGPSTQAVGSKGCPTALAKSLTSSSSHLNGLARSNFREAVIAANFPTSSSLVLLSL